MNYLVFCLSILLIAAGCMSIYTGYDIVEIERGWTAVLAGAVAGTGGVLTLALWVILRRLKELQIFFETRAQTAAVPELGAVKNAAAFEATSPVVAAPSTNFEAPVPAPAPPLNATRSRPAIPPKTAVLEPAPKAEPLKSETQAPSPAGLDEIELLAPGFQAERPAHFSAPATAMESPDALSLDEMWKRVAEDTKEPASAYEDRASEAALKIAEEAEAKTEHPSLDAVAAAAIDEAVQAALFEAEHQPFDPLTERAEDHPPVEISAAYLLEGIGPARAKPMPSDKPASLPVEEPIAFLEPEPAPQVEPPSDHEETLDKAMPQRTAETRRETHVPPPVAPPAAEPAIIGRYEAEGTAYLMFADGSIEAQSAAGIFRFASMAELKTFIEERQTAEV